VTNSMTFEHLSRLAELMTRDEYLDNLTPSQIRSIRRTADSLMSEVPFPITADTIYAMQYGAALDSALTPLASNKPMAAMMRAMGGFSDEPSTVFMLVLAELARRVLDGEIEAPEVSL
jgi:hypothetical protein